VGPEKANKRQSSSGNTKKWVKKKTFFAFFECPLFYEPKIFTLIKFKACAVRCVRCFAYAKNAKYKMSKMLRHRRQKLG